MITPHQIHELPASYGIYQFWDKDKNILYIGKAINLKRRVYSYFQRNVSDSPKTRFMAQLIRYISIIQVNSEFEALILEARLIRMHKPKYNLICRDERHYLYIMITDEEFPKVLPSRFLPDPKSEFYGPFPSTRVVAEIMRSIRHVFPFCTQKISRKTCLYAQLSLCDPCPSHIISLDKDLYKSEKKKYLDNILFIKKILRGKISPVSQYLEEKMFHYSNQNEFENAAIYRNKLCNLKQLNERTFSAQIYLDDPTTADIVRKKERDLLRNVLLPYFPDIKLIHRIEAYDISNIAGSFSAGSMVTFINNMPDKRYYRHFKIKNIFKSDDIHSLMQILTRRLKHKEWKMPDLLVVDGGTPQCRIFQKALSGLNIDLPFIGLAKVYEEIVVPHNDGFIRIKLPLKSDALFLIQRIRDEAHRFAHHYHELLRIKYLFNKK